MFRRLVIAACILVAIIIGVASLTIAFNSPAAPPDLTASNAIPGIEQWNFAELPQRQSLKARDGAPLYYRLYRGRADRVVILVHGSTGSGVEMHKLAQALRAAGASVYAISLRGHGGSGIRNGDVAYVGQLDDDLADLVAGLDLRRPGVHRTLVGFSFGGGFALRIASGKEAGMFDDYLAISPYIAADSPAGSPAAGGGVGVARARTVVLSLLDGVGLQWFQDLPVVAFATDGKAGDTRTPLYSFRLVASLQLGRDWRARLAGISAPTRIVIGARDELFKADQFAPMLRAINPKIEVTLVPEAGHLSMLVDPRATIAIANAWRDLP